MKDLATRKAEREQREAANRDEARESGSLPPEQEEGGAGSGAGTAIVNGDGSKGSTAHTGEEASDPGTSKSKNARGGNGGGDDAGGWSANK